MASEIDRVRFTHTYAVALHSLGQVDEAIRTLERVHASAPPDRDVLFALATFHRDAGHPRDALKYATQLQQLNPNDADAVALVRSLQPSQAP